MTSFMSEAQIEESMYISNAQRRARLDKLMKMFGTSRENLSTEEYGSIVSQILHMRAGLAADAEYSGKFRVKNSKEMNAMLCAVHYQGYMKCAREDFIRFEPQHASTKAEAGLMTAGKTLPKKETGPAGDELKKVKSEEA